MYHFLALVVMLAFGALATLGTASAVQKLVMQQLSSHEAAAGGDRPRGVAPLSAQATGLPIGARSIGSAGPVRH